MVLKFTPYNLDFTEEKKSMEQIAKLIQHKDIKVVGYSEDSNSFGEFLFIHLWDKKCRKGATYYGIGFNNLYDRFITQFKGFESTDHSKCLMDSKPTVTALEMLDKIRSRYYECEKEARQCKMKQSETGKLAEFLSDTIGDDDGVMSELEDMGLI